MAFVSAIRLHLRSWWYLLPFFRHAIPSASQTAHAPGFLGGALGGEGGKGFWTLTMLTDAAAMDAYRTSGAHLQAIRKLMDWCDESSAVHWDTDATEAPAWAEVHPRMAEGGRLGEVRYPSAAHAGGRAVAPAVPRTQRVLRPAK